MAIDTTNEKLALMEWDQVWEPALPISPSTFGQDDKQQLLWGYPGILWQLAALPVHTYIAKTRPSFIAQMRNSFTALTRPSYIAQPRPDYTADTRQTYKSRKR